MRIVLLSFWFSEYTIQLANALSEKEEVTLILPKKFAKIYTKIISKNIKTYLFYYPRLRYPINLLIVYKIIKKIGIINPDVIHLQSGNPWFNLFLPLLKRKYPLITTIHDVKCHLGDKESSRIPLRYLVLKNSSRFIVHGSYLKELLAKKNNIKNNDIAVIPHGELSIYKNFVKKPIHEEKNTILFFGRIWEYKGLRYLIKAEPFISKEITNVKIIIAGRGENIKKYIDLMIHKEKFIIYNNYIKNEMVAKLFQKAAVVVLPYLDGSQSGVVSIAYAFGKPVVVTNVGSIPEVVKDGITGYIVPPKSPKKLAEAIIRILQNDSLRRSMRKKAYEMTQKELSWRNIAAKTIHIYKNAIYKRRNKIKAGS